MLYYFTLFLLFVYFKLARVHKKEEKFTTIIYAQHMMVAIAAIALFMNGFSHMGWFVLVGVSFLFFIVAALLVTAVQLGIFVDGKPVLGISKLYKMMPVLALVIAILSFRLWVI